MVGNRGQALLTTTALLLILLPPSLPAYQLLRLTTDPETIHVGDLARVQLLINLNGDEKVEIPPTLPVSADLDFRSIDARILDQGQVEIVLTLSSFRTGKIELPPLQMGNVNLEQLSFDVASLLDDAPSQLYPERGPRLPPQALSSLAFSVLVALFLPLLLGWLIRRYGRSVGRFLARQLALGESYFVLRRSLRDLHRRCHQRSLEQTCCSLSAVLRSYLSIRLQYPCRSSTAAEIELLLQRAYPSKPWQPLYAALNYCDRIRFGRQPSSTGQCRWHLRQLRQMCRLLRQLEVRK